MPARPLLHSILFHFYLLLMAGGTGLLCADPQSSAKYGQQLADDPQWLALLHMRKGVDGIYRSEVDTPDFFISSQRDNADAELQATIDALQHYQTGAYSPWCRFPARAGFLVRQGVISRPEILQCHDLEQWRARFNQDELVLVYPEPYLKNVASIFGHTFLRFDARDKRAHPVLLSKALSYYADVGSAGGTVTYIAKGLAGNFSGVIEVAPYFQKLRKYSDNEDRDIREYRLNLTPEQISIFIDHVWEVRGHSFNYFFLDENCSYRLISMLDVVTPSHRIRESFSWHAMPVDTVKALGDNGLIAGSAYIPSARKRFYEQYEKLDTHQRAQLAALINEEIHYDDVDDLSVLSLSAHYSGLQMNVVPERRMLHNLQVKKLVDRRWQSGRTAAVEASSVLQAADPVIAGHDMSRVQIGWQHEEGRDYLLLGLRAAYHDWHDPQAAYQRGVQLSVLDAVVRFSGDDKADDISLESLRWFGLQGYSPRDDFFQEASWGFSLSRQRELIGDDRELLHVADGYRGLSYDCGGFLCHAELTGGLVAGSPLDLGWSVRAGARAGILYQRDAWSFSSDISEQYYLVGDPDTVTSFDMAAGYRLARNLSLFGSYAREKNSAENRELLTVSLRMFF